MAAGDWSPVLAEFTIAVQASETAGWTTPPLAEFVITVHPAEAAGWTGPPLAEFVITLEPSETKGWSPVLAEFIVTLQPSQAKGWTYPALAEFVITVSPPGYQPCSIDADCPEGYVCSRGVCVSKGGGFPWGYVALGAAAVGIILLVTSKKDNK
jgi:hypothetical protein